MNSEALKRVIEMAKIGLASQIPRAPAASAMPYLAAVAMAERHTETLDAHEASEARAAAARAKAEKAAEAAAAAAKVAEDAARPDVANG